MMNFLRKFTLRRAAHTPRKSFVTFIEYALLAALVAIAVSVAVIAFRGKLAELWDSITIKTGEVTQQTNGTNLGGGAPQ